jgi:hypothetical protein
MERAIEALPSILNQFRISDRDAIAGGGIERIFFASLLPFVTFSFSEAMTQKTPSCSRRAFLRRSGYTLGATAMTASLPDTLPADESLFRISLAQWTINKELKSGEVDNLDFAKVAHDHGIHAIEYVNQFFMDKARDESYLGEMKKRAEDLGVKSLIIMCDREGNIGDADKKKRGEAIENHRK